MLDDEAGTRVAVDRKVQTRRAEPGWIAARMVGAKLHGYRITRARPLARTHIALRPHQDVCAEYTPPTEQLSLLTPTEETP